MPKRKREFSWHWDEFPLEIRHHILEFFIRRISFGQDRLALVCKEFRHVRLNVLRKAFEQLKRVYGNKEYQLSVFLDYFLKYVGEPGYFAIIHNGFNREWIGSASRRFGTQTDDHQKVEQYDGKTSVRIMEKEEAVEYAVKNESNHVCFCYPDRAQPLLFEADPKRKLRAVCLIDVMDLMWENIQLRRRRGLITLIPRSSTPNTIFYLQLDTDHEKVERIREKTKLWFHLCNLSLMDSI